MSEALKHVLVQKIQVKHTLEQYRRMQLITGKSYKDEINILLERLELLIKLEKELSKKAN